MLRTVKLVGVGLSPVKKNFVISSVRGSKASIRAMHSFSQKMTNQFTQNRRWIADFNGRGNSTRKCKIKKTDKSSKWKVTILSIPLKQDNKIVSVEKKHT